MRVLIFMVIISIIPNSLPAQHIAPAPPDKAVVYFVGTDWFFEKSATMVFNGKVPLGLVGALTYMRYECEPGAHLFWVRLQIPYKSNPSEKQFLVAELAAGKIYVLEVRYQRFGIRLNPVMPLYEINTSLDRVRKTLNKKGSIKLSMKFEKNGYYKHEIDISRVKEGMDVYPDYAEAGSIKKMQSNWFIDPKELILEKKGSRDKVQ